MMHGYGWDHMGSWGWIGMFMMLLFWFGVVALIIWAIGGGLRSNRMSTTPEGPPGGDRSLQILRERFARGDMTPEEYEQARRVLDDDRH